VRLARRSALREGGSTPTSHCRKARAAILRVDLRPRVRVVANQLWRLVPCDRCRIKIANSRRGDRKGTSERDFPACAAGGGWPAGLAGVPGRLKPAPTYKKEADLLAPPKPWRRREGPLYESSRIWKVRAACHRRVRRTRPTS